MPVGTEKSREDLTEEDEPEETLVSEIMITDVHIVSPTTSVKEAAAAMARRGHGCVVVVEGNTAVGMVTERDVVHKVTAEGVDPTKVLVEDIMSTPIITTSPDASVIEAAQKMSLFQIRRIVVASEDGNLLGLLTAIDIARWLAKRTGYTDPTLNAIARLKQSPAGGPYR